MESGNGSTEPVALRPRVLGTAGKAGLGSKCSGVDPQVNFCRAEVTSPAFRLYVLNFCP